MATVWDRVNESLVMFRRSIFLVMVVKLLGCQESVGDGGLGAQDCVSCLDSWVMVLDFKQRGRR